MFKRRAYDDLLRWKCESRGARALLLEGARRVGKSTLAREFAEREYAAHLVIDFSEASDDLKMLFRDYRADVDSFFMYLAAASKFPHRVRRGAALPACTGVHQTACCGRSVRLPRNWFAHIHPAQRRGHRYSFRGDCTSLESAELRRVPLGGGRRSACCGYSCFL